MTVGDALDLLERIAPSRFALSWDRIGLQVGDRSQPAGRAAVTLDSSLASVRFAAEQGCRLLIAHHPLIWDPLPRIDADNVRQLALIEAIRHGIAVVACHTNWDAAPGGINDTLLQRLGMAGGEAFGLSEPERTFKLVVFVPSETRGAMISALSAAGCGVIGRYEQCAFWTSGTGTFFGGPGANPSVGEAGHAEQPEEDRLEMLCPASSLSAALAVLHQVHPYEEPAYDVIPLADKPGQRLGRLGRLPRPMSVADLANWVNGRLGTLSLAWGGGESLSYGAVVGGAAGSEWKAARAAGAEFLVTGEIRQDQALEAAESGFVVIQAGHYATEQPGMEALCQRLIAGDLDSILFEPAPGQAGRPL